MLSLIISFRMESLKTFTEYTKNGNISRCMLRVSPAGPSFSTHKTGKFVKSSVTISDSLFFESQFLLASDANFQTSLTEDNSCKPKNTTVFTARANDYFKITLLC